MAVTAPQAAIPPAMNDLHFRTQFRIGFDDVEFQGSPRGSRHYSRRRTERRGLSIG